MDDGPLRDPPKLRLTQLILLPRFQLLSSGRPGTLRRAHSEELMSEVGVAAAANNTNGSNNSDDITLNGDLNNAHCYGGSSYKGLQVRYAFESPKMGFESIQIVITFRLTRIFESIFPYCTQ